MREQPVSLQGGISAPKIRYSMWRRTKAFVRGLIRGGPLLEVAIEAFRGDYALTPQLETRYKARITSRMGKNGFEEGLPGILKSGCSTYGQGLFAGIFREEFSSTMESLLKAIKASEGRSIAEVRSKGLKNATRLTRLRTATADLIQNNSINSPDAQLVLEPLFRHYEDFEQLFPSHSKAFHYQIERLLASPHTAPALRSTIIESMRLVPCDLCSAEFIAKQGLL